MRNHGQRCYDSGSPGQAELHELLFVKPQALNIEYVSDINICNTYGDIGAQELYVILPSGNGKILGFVQCLSCFACFRELIILDPFRHIQKLNLQSSP